MIKIYKMKKKITKKEIHSILTNGTKTEIHKLVHIIGLDANNKSIVFNFIRDNAKTQKILNRAYCTSYGRNHTKQIRNNSINERSTYFREYISSAIRFAKQQKNDGGWGNYSKILFIGDRNIYWCHPGYGHSDYNKSIAFSNTEKNRKISYTINKYLGYKL
jgi:hypothetical protein